MSLFLEKWLFQLDLIVCLENLGEMLRVSVNRQQNKAETHTTTIEVRIGLGKQRKTRLKPVQQLIWDLEYVFFGTQIHGVQGHLHYKKHIWNW